MGSDNLTYEELLKYNIYDAIKKKAEEEKELFSDNNPAKIENNPLLSDFDYVYQHAEYLFYFCIFHYQNYQKADQYFTLFKALTTKYNLEEDYSKYINTDAYSLKLKWGRFCVELYSFLYHAMQEDEVLIEVINKKEVIDYFTRFSYLYDNDTLFRDSTAVACGELLKYPQFNSYYLGHPKDLIYLIKKYLFLKVPAEVMLNENVIQEISHNMNMYKFYSMLYYVGEQVSEYYYLEEHKKYLDFQIDHMKDGILPCFYDAYLQSDYNIAIDNLRYFAYKWHFDANRISKIFKEKGTNKLKKEDLFKVLTKEYLLDIYISRHFETYPDNLIIDIETLTKFAKENNRSLKGQIIYDFIENFEEKSIDEIIAFYNASKNINSKEILYDDWNKQVESFVRELNESILLPEKIKDHEVGLFNEEKEQKFTEDAVKVFDITDIDAPILVHNTSVSKEDNEKIDKTLDRIKTGYKDRLCLSLQDKNHTTFYTESYTEEEKNKEIKLVFGKMEENRVGIVYHEDAYSIDINDTEFGNFSYSQRLYTVKSLLDNTIRYNEINYVISHKPFLPVALLCEDKIDNYDVTLASKMNIPIFFREKNKVIENTEVGKVNKIKEKGYRTVGILN